MKKIFIIVEGQTEQEFVRRTLSNYLLRYGIFDVRPILIHTSKYGRGGFLRYRHLRKDIYLVLQSNKGDGYIVTTMVDYFRSPAFPQEDRWRRVKDSSERLDVLEKIMKEDVDDPRFIPYIQMHEFEALLFSSMVGFERRLGKRAAKELSKVMEQFETPEDINTSPEGAPSKRIIRASRGYNKIIVGNRIAEDVGMETMLLKCPHFREWVNTLISKASE